MNTSWSVEYVELKDKKPFEEFIFGLSKKERAKIFETINYFLGLKNENLLIKESLSKHIEDGIFELRTSLRDKIARSLYFYQRGSKIVITHGFIKKTRKTPRKEIERAKELREQYIKRLKHD
jgi:phage-related protein